MTGGDRDRAWDVAKDGRFLMLRENLAGQTPAHIVVVENWFQELIERVPVP